MHALSLLIASLTVAAASPSRGFEARQAAVASVDRYTGPGCSGTVCNIAGSGDLHTGCNVITGACQASLKLSYANPGCKVTIWKNDQCKDTTQFANVTSYDCYALGPPIKGISVDC
ncbi:hypothetical protein EK21DRAFT_72101 [Setomelanomma holmii]|uniref:Uncharacterized protein n=1 Tax=Setomelanomma holmii TaxID=210430 RepID=A0A9P4H2U7_9PLEO|nr:hypothetical protein EK21DRAFT_72101 [Setomelanomma holmii]